MRIDSDLLEYGHARLLMMHGGQPFTGTALEVLPSGTRSEIEYVAGSEHGVTREWTASGHLIGGLASHTGSSPG